LPGDGDSDAEPLGNINGKPKKEVILTERDLLQHLKDAHKEQSLVYCKQMLELDAETNKIVNDPIKLFVNISNIVQET